MTVLFATSQAAAFGGSASDVTSVTANNEFDSARVLGAVEVQENTSATIAWSAGATRWLAMQASFVDGDFEASADTAGHGVLKIRDANGETLAIVQDETPNNYRFTASAVGDTTVQGSESASLARQTLHALVVKVAVTASNIDVELYANGVLASSASASNSTSGKGGAASAEIEVKPKKGTAWISELMIADSSLVNARMVELAPSTAGGEADWNGTIASIADRSTATGLTTKTAGARSSWDVDTFTLPAGEQITELVVAGQAQRLATGPSTVTPMLRIGTTNYDGTAESIDIGSTNFAHSWATDPSDSAAWTETKINAAESGVVAG